MLRWILMAFRPLSIGPHEKWGLGRSSETCAFEVVGCRMGARP